MNAVFERDFVAFSTSARFRLLRFGFAAAMSVLLAGQVMRAHASSDFAGVGGSLFTIAVLVGFTLIVVFVPSSFSTVLVHARAGSTLPVLLATPLSPLSIAAGAFLARASIVLVFLLATLPPLALALLYGGLAGGQLFAALAALAATALAMAAPAFLVSAFARRTGSAVVTAYLIAAALLAALYACGAGLEGDPALAALAPAVSPLHAVGAVLGAARGSVAVSGVAAPYVLLFWTAAASTGAVLAAAWRLSREGRGGADAPGRPLAAGRTCRPLVHENPVLDRELKSAGLVRGQGAARGLFVLLLLAEAAYAIVASVTHEPQSIRLHFTVLAIEVLLITLAVTAAGATALAAEREGRTLDLVRSTPLTPREIVTGKLAGILRTFLPSLLVPLAHLVWAAATGIVHPLAIPLVLVCGAVSMGVWSTFALSQSLDQPNPNRAVMRTMGAFGILGVLVAANVGLPLSNAFGDADDYVRIGMAFGANPVAITLLPAAALRTGGSDVQNTVLAPPGPGTVAAAFVACALWLALYATAGMMVYRRLFHLYRSRVDG